MKASRLCAGCAVAIVAAAFATLASASPDATSASASPSALRVAWMHGYKAPGTPARYDKVGVLKVGPRSAKNVLVLEPGTSAGSAYFVPLAQWLTSKLHGWQVWSVERRENLLEDQSVINEAKRGEASPQQVFDYYFGYLLNHSITHHFNPVQDSSVEFAKGWGLKVAVEDLRRVIAAARKLGGKVVLGGHSLGGSVVTAYATWDFGGKPGADGLAGLIYDDGGSFRGAPTAQKARRTLRRFESPGVSPWLPFVSGIPPYDSGLFGVTGGLATIVAPNQPLANGEATILSVSPGLKPPAPVSNEAEFGYATSVATSKLGFALMAHDGAGIDSTPMANGVYGWNSAGAITPIERFARMFSGYPLQNVDGLEWYFPQRLTDDSAAIDNGNANPAQHVFGIDATMGHRLPHSLRMYAFGAYGGNAILQATIKLAKQSHIARRNLVLVNRHGTYAHNDPAGAYPHNVFFQQLVAFLGRIA
jgi:pimeloyl-ACP methyl ester carboxylesterase